MGLLPIAWVLSLRQAGRAHDRRWIVLALAFAMSWIADSLSHAFDVAQLGPLYLIGQAGFIVWALAARTQLWRFLIVLIGTLNAAMILLDLSEPDILMHTVAWLGVLVICWPLPLIPSLRWTLAMMCGAALLAWCGYVLRPSWTSWGIYQGIRATAIVLFCRAAWHPRPLLVEV